VAAVAAVDAATASRDLQAIKITVRQLPAYYTVDAALAIGAVKIHQHRPNNIDREVLFEAW
jgi:4-hydroxybenzoyl-CoA reductase subunit alpha